MQISKKVNAKLYEFVQEKRKFRLNDPTMIGTWI